MIGQPGSVAGTKASLWGCTCSSGSGPRPLTAGHRFEDCGGLDSVGWWLRLNEQVMTLPNCRMPRDRRCGAAGPATTPPSWPWRPTGSVAVAAPVFRCNPAFRSGPMLAKRSGNDAGIHDMVTVAGLWMSGRTLHWYALAHNQFFQPCSMKCHSTSGSPVVRRD